MAVLTILMLLVRMTRNRGQFARTMRSRSQAPNGIACPVPAEQTHHDALEFPDGQIVLLTRLCEGQRATVLQLPAAAHRATGKEAARPEVRSSSPVRRSRIARLSR